MMIKIMMVGVIVMMLIIMSIMVNGDADGGTGDDSGILYGED